MSETDRDIRCRFCRRTASYQRGHLCPGLNLALRDVEAELRRIDREHRDLVEMRTGLVKLKLGIGYRFQNAHEPT